MSQEELAAYVTEQAYRMGVPPDRLAKELSERGQLAAVVADVLRGKALTLLTERASITDESGRNDRLKADEAAEEALDDGGPGRGRRWRRRRARRHLDALAGGRTWRPWTDGDGASDGRRDSGDGRGLVSRPRDPVARVAARLRPRSPGGAPRACAHSEQAPAADFPALAAGYGHCNDTSADTANDIAQR